ncbi:hypothetical protein K491DRAFT_86524 [Lophiostoma macrostomum CBS 122681]|uniref:Uncharacterized protein n=1 Tax=Lophiostoma macrostomum CBS 122681 TaxID=1314788 RepID=A0A6A6SV39_9PLEO|nr:hypothetical protein K491DRAFT_86524 [Lophiostoma macrostomum CBS 122681]
MCPRPLICKRSADSAPRLRPGNWEAVYRRQQERWPTVTEAQPARRTTSRFDWGALGYAPTSASASVPASGDAGQNASTPASFLRHQLREDSVLEGLPTRQTGTVHADFGPVGEPVRRLVAPEPEFPFLPPPPRPRTRVRDFDDAYLGDDEYKDKDEDGDEDDDQPSLCKSTSIEDDPNNSLDEADFEDEIEDEITQEKDTASAIPTSSNSSHSTDSEWGWESEWDSDSSSHFSLIEADFESDGDGGVLALSDSEEQNKSDVEPDPDSNLPPNSTEHGFSNPDARVEGTSPPSPSPSSSSPSSPSPPSSPLGSDLNTDQDNWDLYEDQYGRVLVDPGPWDRGSWRYVTWEEAQADGVEEDGFVRSVLRMAGVGD